MVYCLVFIVDIVGYQVKIQGLGLRFSGFGFAYQSNIMSRSTEFLEFFLPVLYRFLNQMADTLPLLERDGSEYIQLQLLW